MKQVELILSFFFLLTVACCSPQEEPAAKVVPQVAPVVNTSTANCKAKSTLSTNDANLLFIGNSLTYTNNLPDIIERLANERGIKIGTQMVAKPNYALEDHWNEGCIQTLIDSKMFDFVIVQQGPSSQEEGRVMLLEYGAHLKDLCNRNDAKLTFFMVWPAKVNYHTFDGVILNYTNAALQTDALLCPVGKFWKAQCDKGDFSYYGSDQFHPSLKGSEMAAKTIVDTLFP